MTGQGFGSVSRSFQQLSSKGLLRWGLAAHRGHDLLTTSRGRFDQVRTIANHVFEDFVDDPLAVARDSPISIRIGSPRGEIARSTYSLNSGGQ